MRQHHCSRAGCNNTYSEIYIDEVGYICSDCKKEFKSFLKVRGLKPIADADFKISLSSFMKTPKKSGDSEVLTINQFFSKYTMH